MNEPLPAPLSPSDCDLRGYDFMGLYGRNLFKSQFYHLSLQTPRTLRAGWAGLKLWWESFEGQVPAGSLPTDDRELARLADFGSDLRGWLKVKEHALRGFILCSDGRLYHPFICEKAKAAFEKRRKDRERKRDKKASVQNAQPIENIENMPSNSDGMGAELPRTVRGNSVLRERGRERGREVKTEATYSTEPVPQTARVASLNVVQGSDEPTVEAAPVASADQPAPVHRSYMPRANDPPHVWIGSGLSKGPDGYPRTILHGMKPHLVAGKHGLNRVMVDDTARLICTAALIDHSWRGDWHVLVNWLDEGLDAGAHILPAITEVVERQSKGPKGYRQPTTLRYFDAAIREYAARCRVA